MTHLRVTVEGGGSPYPGKWEEEGAPNLCREKPKALGSPASWFPTQGRPLLSTVLVPFSYSRAPEDQTDQLGSRGPGV